MSLRRSLDAPLSVLVAEEIIPSAESLARVVPQITAQVRAAGVTDPELRRTTRSSRLPSSLVMSRTRTRSATLPPSTTRCRRESPSGCPGAGDSHFKPTGPTLPAVALE